MEFNIGENIKRLRMSRAITQEQLSELLNISAVAVSKWESKNTYPDITMLFSIAEIFEVSIDELLGYNEVKLKREIEKLIEKYHELSRNGYFAEATEMIYTARRKYPHDYLVMHTYMWDKAGGFADNDPDVIIKNKDEFNRICDCILNGCQDESIRYEALTMRAKILHMSGDTEGAPRLLDKFPSWYQSSEQKKEQLFGKDTPEYYYYNKRNFYQLMEFTANKLARLVWYGDSLSFSEKVKLIERMGDEFLKLCRIQGMESFCVFAHMLYAVLSEKLSREGELQDIIRIREKEFTASEKIMCVSENDEILACLIREKYKTDNIVSWLADWLLNSNNACYQKLRDSPEYTEMLLKRKE